MAHKEEIIVHGVPTEVWAMDSTAQQIDDMVKNGGSLEISSGFNLLDNWYFVGGGSQQGSGQFPINQRGKTEYTEVGYTIDRWRLIANKAAKKFSLSLEDSGVKLSVAPSSASVYFDQTIENASDYYGKTVTCSLLYSGNLLTATAQVPTEGVSKNTRFYVTLGNNIRLELWLTEKNGLIVQYNTFDVDEILLRAIKLELGATQTLAHQDKDGNWVLNDPPPNYQQELAKCQRYLHAFGTEEVRAARITPNYIRAWFPTGVPLRANPELVSGAFQLKTLASGNMMANAVWSYEVQGNGISVIATVETGTVSDAVIYSSTAMVSADL